MNRYRLCVTQDDPKIEINIPEPMLIAIENKSILKGHSVNTEMLILWARSLETDELAIKKARQV